MPGHTVLLTGAGYSKPFGCPLLSELLTAEVCVRSRAAQGTLAALRALVKDTNDTTGGASLEAAFSRIWDEQFTGEPFNLNGQVWSASQLLEGLRLHLGSVCAYPRLDHRRPLVNALERFLHSLTQESRSLTIVTFNYDILTEEALNHANLSYSYGPRRAVRFVEKARERLLDRREPDVELLKLHGSVNWGVCRDCSKASIASDLINAFERAYVPPRNASCQFCNKKYLEVSIIPPVISKGPALRSLAPIWERARKRLSRARELIAVGYSLPEADSQAAALLKSVIAPLKRPRISVICGRNGVPPAYSKVFPRFTAKRELFEDYLEDY